MSLWGHHFSQNANQNYKVFCPTTQTRIVALFFGDFLESLGSFLGYDPCLLVEQKSL